MVLVQEATLGVIRKRALYTNITGVPTQLPVRDDDYKRRDYDHSSVIIEVLVTSGSPTFSLQPRQSFNGTNWYTIGGALVAAGVTSITTTMPYFDVLVSSLSGGGITINAG